MIRPTEPQWRCDGCHEWYGAQRKWFRVPHGFLSYIDQDGTRRSRAARLCDYCHEDHQVWKSHDAA